MDQNLIAGGDLPRFVMDSYEECRGPPRLFLLDKFDVAGAGACLKRYTDPSFFKVEVEVASSIGTKSEIQREKRTRKVKRRASRWRNGGTPESFRSSHAKLHQLLLEDRIENSGNDTERRVKLKKRELTGPPFDEKAGRSYMDKFLESCLPEQRVVHEISVNPLPLHMTSSATCESGLEVVEIGTVSPTGETLQTERITSPSPNMEEMVVKSSVYELNEIIDKETTGISGPNYESDADKSTFGKVETDEELAVYTESKSESSVYEFNSDEIASEMDNYMDALATMESENETDREYRTNRDLQYVSNFVMDCDASGGQDEAKTELLDCVSVENANTSDSGNSSFKNRESFSCSLSNFVESTTDGDGAAIAIFSAPGSVTDLADVSSNLQSVSEEIPGNDTPERAGCTSTLVAAVETQKEMPKFGEASCSSCLTDLNTTLQSSDKIVSLGENSALGAEGDEITSTLNRIYPMSLESNQRGEHETVDVSCKETLLDAPPKAKDNHLLPFEGHPVEEMACGDSDFSCKTIRDLLTASDAPEDNCNAKLNEAADTESANDDSLLNLVDEAIDSPHSPSSADDECNRESGLPGAEACSEVASLQKNSPICNPGQDIERPAMLALDEDHCVPSTEENSENLSLPIDSGLPQAEPCLDVASLQKNSPICNSGPDIGKPSKLYPDEDHHIPSIKEYSENVCLPVDSARSGYQVEQHFSEITDAGLSPQLDLQEQLASIHGDELGIMRVSTAAENEEPVESVLPVHQRETPAPVPGPLQTHRLPQQLLQDVQEEPAGALKVHSLEDSETNSRVTANAEVIDESIVNFDMSELDPSQTEITSKFLPLEAPDAALLPQYTSEPVKPDSNNPCTVEDFNSVVLNEDECSPSVEPVEKGAVCLDLAPICLDQSGSTSVCKMDARFDKTSTEAVTIEVNAAGCDGHSRCGGKDGAILCNTISVGLPSEDLDSSNYAYLDSIAPEVVVSNANRTNAVGVHCGDDVALSSKLDSSTPSYHQKLQEESSEENRQQNVKESKELPLQHVADLYATMDVNNVAVAPINSESNPFPLPYVEHPDLKLVSDRPDSSLAKDNRTRLEFIGDAEAVLCSQKCIQNLESNSSQNHLQGDDIHTVNGNLAEPEVHVENEMDLVTSGSLNGLIQDSQHNDKEILVGAAASDSYPVPPLSQPSMSWLLHHSAEHEYDSSGEAVVPSASSFPQSGMPIAENLASSTLDDISQSMDPSCSGFPIISILRSPTEINLKEMPPLPPLPPMQWRLRRLQHSFLPMETQMMQQHGPAQVSAQLAMDGNAERVSKTSEAVQVEYVKSFVSFSTEEDEEFQDMSRCVGGYTAGTSAEPVPAMTNEHCQQNAFSVDSRQDKALFSTPEACTRPQNGVQCSETVLYHPTSKLSEPGPTIESIASGHIMGSTGAKNMQLETAFLDEHHPQIPSVVEEKFLKAPVQFVPPQALHYEQQLPQGFMAPAEVPAWLSNPSSTTLASEDGNVNGTLQKKLPRPRNPLIDAVVALDKSKLRKVERVKSQVVERTEERDILLEQIRNKSFNLRPAVNTRPSIQGPRTNLKVAAILEKANTIRQAMAGSDEDDSDSWSDS
ncbi:hypothetical protein Ancab_014206 [Ancistrocladus abbreviatus]